MFWRYFIIFQPVNACVTIFLLSCRFGFHNTSAIDSLLDKDDVSLEAILDEDDLLQECKSQNTRLIDYFQRDDVLKRLLAYVTGEIEGAEERGRFKCVTSSIESLLTSNGAKIPICCHRSPLQRHLVYRGDLRKPQRGTSCPVLGNCT